MQIKEFKSRAWCGSYGRWCVWFLMEDWTRTWSLSIIWNFGTRKGFSIALLRTTIIDLFLWLYWSLALSSTDHQATWEFMGKHLTMMDKEVAHIGMNSFTHTSLLLYHFPLFLIVLWFLAIAAQVAFDMFAKHLVVIIASNWTFRFQTISS